MNFPNFSCSSCFEIFAALFFCVVSLAHIVRLVAGWSLRIGPFSIPKWVSVAAAVAGAFAAIWGFSLPFIH